VVGISIFESVAVAGVIVQLYFRYTGHKKKLYSNINFRKKISAGLLKSVQKMAVIIIAAVTILTGAGIYFIVNADYSLLNSEKTLITSHRGSSVSAPENTIASIKAAVDAMADYAEIDARSTKDGVVIVFHDPSLKRITGINKKVWQVKYSQIIGMDAGSWFSKKFSGEKIPTLKQILEYSKGKIKLNIEIKTSPGDKDLEESIVKLIEEYDMTDSCVVSSFSYNSLKKIKKLNPDIRTGYIISGVYGNFYDLEYADFFSMRQSIVTERIVTELHKRKKELHVWTVNDKYSINRLARLGVDNIITDDPVKARSIIYSADLPEYTTDFLELVFHY
jgi:glycerophosphoryl diester phosphodiesterase